ncbi:MAG: hypothetical protein Q4D96_05725 [Propionibacteriaceae bacterium]|nr:hypothetical protein [Propionibacteriaceae bacterium]
MIQNLRPDAGVLRGEVALTVGGVSATVPFTLDDETGSLPSPSESERLVAQWDGFLSRVDLDALLRRTAVEVKQSDYEPTAQDHDELVADMWLAEVRAHQRELGLWLRSRTVLPDMQIVATVGLDGEVEDLEIIDL